MLNTTIGSRSRSIFLMKVYTYIMVCYRFFKSAQLVISLQLIKNYILNHYNETVQMFVSLNVFGTQFELISLVYTLVSNYDL